jgi:hypothetical protein
MKRPMKIWMIYLGSFAVATVAMALVLFGVSEDKLPWRDALIIGAVFGSLVPITLWRWPEEQRARRHFLNTVRFVIGLDRR